MRDRSTVSKDPFSDVLGLAEARSVISGGFAAGGTWAFRFPAPEEIVFSAIAPPPLRLQISRHLFAAEGPPGAVMRALRWVLVVYLLLATLGVLSSWVLCALAQRPAEDAEADRPPRRPTLV